MKKEKIPVEALDQTMYLSESENADLLMHCCIEFESHVNEEILKQSISQTLNLEKILHYCIDRRFFNLYWQEVTGDLLNQIYSVETIETDGKKEVCEFINLRIDVCKEPMLKIRLFRKEDKDILVFKVHHIITDATGFLNYVSKIIYIYNQLQKNPDFIHPDYKAYHRTIQPIKDRYTKKEIRKIMMQSRDVMLKEKVSPFPWNKKPVEDLYFITYDISTENMESIANYCKEKKCTINDFLSAAIYKTYYTYRNELLGIRTTYNPFFLTLDLRNYCRPKNNNALHNYSSGLLLQYRIDPESDIDTIIQQMQELTKDLKLDIAHFNEKEIPGLSTVFALEKTLKMVPFGIMKKGCDLFRGKVGTVLTYANLGDLEMIVDQWDGLKVDRAYMTKGVISCAGAMFFDSSCFYSKCIFAMNYRGNKENTDKVLEFLRRFEKICNGYFVNENTTDVFTLPLSTD